MRIISDFHDYYDAVQATGQDQSLIYLRKPEEVEVSEYPFPILSYYTAGREPRGPSIRQRIVGFCGKIYPVLELTHVATSAVAICYNLNEVDCFVEHNFRKDAIEEYRTKAKSNRRYWGRHWPTHLRRDAFEKHFAACAEKRDSFAKMFLETRCPVFIGTADQHAWKKWSRKIVYHGCLKDLEFFRLFDSYTAFQEIAMFLGGLAVPLKPIPQVPDKIMVGAKGFDKWSFRKLPEE
jgi:hypothetical protein